MEETILNLLGRPDYTPLNAAEIVAQLGRRNDQGKVERVLARMERSGQIARVKQGNRYALPVDADLVPGRIRMNRQGVGFLQADDPKFPSIRIPQDATAPAMHGDHVLVRMDGSGQAAGRGKPAQLQRRVGRVAV